MIGSLSCSSHLQKEGIIPSPTIIERIDSVDQTSLDRFERDKLAYCRSQLLPEQQRIRKERDPKDNIDSLAATAKEILKKIKEPVT